MYDLPAGGQEETEPVVGEDGSRVVSVAGVSLRRGLVTVGRTRGARKRCPGYGEGSIQDKR